MPFCHRHPRVPVVTDPFGVSSCRACEAEASAAMRRQCRQCGAPVARPGLCPACGGRVRRARLMAWVADHQYWIMLGLVALLAYGTYVAIDTYLVQAFKAIDEAPAYQVGS
jgi:endogenous inhibitor of DNA gyrase (YacG/DUF329 family)